MPLCTRWSGKSAGCLMPIFCYGQRIKSRQKMLTRSFQLKSQILRKTRNCLILSPLTWCMAHVELQIGRRHAWLTKSAASNTRGHLWQRLTPCPRSAMHRPRSSAAQARHCCSGSCRERGSDAGDPQGRHQWDPGGPVQSGVHHPGECGTVGRCSPTKTALLVAPSR